MRRSLPRQRNRPHGPEASDLRRKMRIRTDSAASAASLAEYLRRCECIVELIDRRIIEASARPQSFAAAHAELELEGYLTVWQAMHPEALTLGRSRRLACSRAGW
jgi:hypothetical protein